MAGSLIMYVVLGVTAALGSLIAWDDLRTGKCKETRAKSSTSDNGIS